MTSPLTAGGLILDVAGAIGLASAFMFKKPRDVRAEGSSYWDFNAPLVVSLAKQTADAWVGGALLVLGFLGQFAQSVGWRPSGLRLFHTIPAAVAVAVGAFLLLWFVLRPWNVRRAIASMLTGQREAGRLTSWQGAIIVFARMLGREIQPGERPADLVIWMIGEKRWRRVTTGVNIPEDVRDPYQPQ
jgi:hypothetical protein